MYELRIKHLEEAHRALDKQIDTLEKNGLFEDLRLETLKKERLLLKDKLAIIKHKQELQEQAYMATSFTLNRTQVEKLAKMAAHFKEVEWFTLESAHTSGIGPSVTVKFNLFNDDDKDIDTTVDITDVSTW